MADWNYIVGPWDWRPEGRRSMWLPPPGFIGGLDFCRRSDLAVPGAPRASGLFWGPVGATFDTASYSQVFTGDCRQPLTGTGAAQAMRSVLNLERTPQGDTIARLVFDALLMGDPAGENSVKPLVPIAGNLTLWMFGHTGACQAEPFVWGHRHTNRLRDALRLAHKSIRAKMHAEAKACRDAARQLRKQAGDSAKADRLDARAEKLDLKPRMVLGDLVRKYGCDWRELSPDGDPPLDPQTTHTESFAGSGANLDGDLTWTEGDADWARASGKAVRTDVTGAYARAEHDVSSADHVASVIIGADFSMHADDYGEAMVLARYDSAADNGYAARIIFDVTNCQRFQLVRVDAGAQTGLAGPTTSTDSTLYIPGSNLECYCNGSTISAAHPIANLRNTDTTYTVETRGGVYLGYEGAGTTSVVSFESWEISDDDGSYILPSSDFNSSGYLTDTGVTFSHTCGNDRPYRYLVVRVAIFNSTATVSGVTYDGSALTLLRSEDAGTYRAEIWSLVAPTGGSAENIVVTMSASCDFVAIARSYTGVYQADPVEGITGDNGTSVDPSVPVTVTAAFGWVISVIASADTSFFGAGGEGMYESGANGSTLVRDDGDLAPGVSNVDHSSHGSETWALAAVVLRPHAAGAIGGGAGIPIFVHHYRQQGIM